MVESCAGHMTTQTATDIKAHVFNWLMLHYKHVHTHTHTMGIKFKFQNSITCRSHDQEDGSVSKTEASLYQHRVQESNHIPDNVISREDY